MKKEIMAYITALENVYSGTINQPMIKALNDLECFVADIKEEDSNGEDLYIKRIVELEEEIEDIKSKFAETEESLTNMIDNESRLNKRVGIAELAAKGYESAIAKIMAENVKLHKDLMFWESNR